MVVLFVLIYAVGGAAIECGKMHDHFTFAGLMSRTSLLHCCCCFLCLVAVVWIGCYLKCITKPFFDCVAFILFVSLWVCCVSVCQMSLQPLLVFVRLLYETDSSNKKSELQQQHQPSRLKFQAKPMCDTQRYARLLFNKSVTSFGGFNSGYSIGLRDLNPWAVVYSSPTSLEDWLIISIW